MAGLIDLCFLNSPVFWRTKSAHLCAPKISGSQKPPAYPLYFAAVTAKVLSLHPLKSTDSFEAVLFLLSLRGSGRTMILCRRTSPQSRLDTKLVCREALRAWLDDHVKQSTFTSYRTYVQKHFAPVLGRFKLRDLTPRELQYFCHFKQKSEGLRLSWASA